VETGKKPIPGRKDLLSHEAPHHTNKEAVKCGEFLHLDKDGRKHAYWFAEPRQINSGLIEKILLMR
jgi:hypothetical protein